MGEGHACLVNKCSINVGYVLDVMWRKREEDRIPVFKDASFYRRETELQTPLIRQSASLGVVNGYLKW